MMSRSKNSMRNEVDTVSNLAQFETDPSMGFKKLTNADYCDSER